MRKHMYLITDHPNEELVGTVEIRDKPYVMGEKNAETTIRKRNVETGNGHTQRVVGLGYEDFDGEEDYDARSSHVVHQKMGEIDPEHIEAAGLDLLDFA